MSMPSMLEKIAPTDPTGTLEKALERSLLNVDHNRPLPLLGLTLGEVPETHLIRIKPAFQGVGSVPGGSGECDE